MTEPEAMPLFKCQVNGRNFLIRMDGEKKKHGFYKTVYVESVDSEQAELDAVDHIRNSEVKDLILNEREDPPMIYVTEIAEVELKGDGDPNPGGQSWYEE